MKKVEVWLNDVQFHMVKQKASNQKITVYAYVKDLILKSLEVRIG